MRTFVIKLALLTTAICLSFIAHAQDDGVILVKQAAHCLAAKGFLPHADYKELTFGYLLDEKSYPDKKLLYVVNYQNSSRPDGFVFTIFLTKPDSRQNFDIQNNARFTRAKDGRASFVAPPLGGTWTRNHLVSAIKQIEKQPRLTILAKEMLTIGPSVGCEAYTDPQPKPNAK
jgi:hypothetical protein